MDISETTKKLYATHARRFERWLAANGKPVDRPESYSDALDHLTRALGRRSWRLYRNALTWHLRVSFGDGFAVRFVALTDELVKPAEKRRRLARHVDPEVLRVIVHALRGRRGVNGRRIADLMIAMVATGIRQREWTSATLCMRSMEITVRNAKYRATTPDVPGRGNGITRQLMIDPTLPTSVIGSIQRTIAWLNGKAWLSIAPNVNKVFREVVRDRLRAGEIPGRWAKIRVYDCRHQFSADAKASLSLLSGEVAAAMGHRSAVTAVSHYGKRKYASGRSAVRPSPSSVAAVSADSLVKVRTMIDRTYGRLHKSAQAPEIALAASVEEYIQRFEAGPVNV